MAETIVLRGGHHEESGIFTTAATPGMLMEPDGTGGWQPHATAGGRAAPIFARAQSENQGADIDDDIAVNDEGTLVFPNMGAKINAFTSDTIAEGNFVESDGAGGVRVFGSGYVIGIARGASDLSGTNGRVVITVFPSGV